MEKEKANSPLGPSDVDVLQACVCVCLASRNGLLASSTTESRADADAPALPDENGLFGRTSPPLRAAPPPAGPEGAAAAAEAVAVAAASYVDVGVGVDGPSNPNGVWPRRALLAGVLESARSRPTLCLCACFNAPRTGRAEAEEEAEGTGERPTPGNAGPTFAEHSLLRRLRRAADDEDEEEDEVAAFPTPEELPFILSDELSK